VKRRRLEVRFCAARNLHGNLSSREITYPTDTLPASHNLGRSLQSTAREDRSWVQLATTVAFASTVCGTTFCLATNAHANDCSEWHRPLLEFVIYKLHHHYKNTNTIAREILWHRSKQVLPYCGYMSRTPREQTWLSVSRHYRFKLLSSQRLGRDSHDAAMNGCSIEYDIS
jgi:hypothetical protein